MTRATRGLRRSFLPFFTIVFLASAFRPAGTAVSADPEPNVQAAIDAAVCLKRQQRYEEAITQYLKVLETAPKSVSAHNNLAWLLATCPTDRLRDGKKAVVHATKACELSEWKLPHTIGTLSAALAEDGQFEKAIELLTKHRAGATESTQWLFDQHLARFRAKKTYCQAEQERIAHDANIPEVRKAVLMSLCQKAVALEQARRIDEAVVQYEKAIARAKDILGKDHVEVGRLLSRLADVHFNCGKFDRAVGYFTEAIAIYRQHLSRSDSEVTYAYNNLAGALANLGREEEAIRLDLANLKVREASLGKQHPHTLLSLRNLGMNYRSSKHPREAIETLETWLKLAPRGESERELPFAILMTNLGSSYLQVHEFDKAEECLLRGLAVVEALPKEDLQKICVLEHLTDLYGRKGPSSLAKVKKHGDRSVELCRQRFGSSHPETARALVALAVAYRNAGALAEAEKVAMSAMDSLESCLVKNSSVEGMRTIPVLLGQIAGRRGHPERFEQRLDKMISAVEAKVEKDDRAIACAYSLAAHAYMEMGGPDQIQKYAKRALAIQRKRPVADDLALAETLQCLGFAASQRAQYADSESYHLECLHIREKKLGQEHSLVASSLSDLGFVYFRMQRYQEAEKTLRRAIAISEKAGPDGVSSLAISLGYLGRVYTEQRKNAEAESCLKRSLELTRQQQGDCCRNYAWSLVYLAQFHTSAGQFEKAETVYRQALDVFQKTGALDTAGRSVAMSGLGETLMALGKSEESDQVLRKSLEGFNQRRDGNDRDRFITTNLLIERCVRAKRWEEAIEHCTESRQAGRRWLAHVLPAMAPSEQLVYLFQEERLPLCLYLSIAMRCADKPKAVEASAEWVLNSKATGAACLAAQMQGARQSDDPTVKQTMRDLAAVREQLSGLVLRPKSGSGAEQEAQQAALSEKERDLSRKLGLLTKAGSQDEAWTTLADVRKALPADAVLIEILRFPVTDIDGWLKRTTIRYVAWVIPSAGSGQVQMVDLGDAETIDTAVAKSRGAIATFPKAASVLGVQQAAQQVETASSRLAELVYKPLTKAIGNASALLVSPDGGLWLFPWEALPTGDGKFLVEQKQIGYLVTGRTLLNKSGQTSGSGAVLFADPDYDMEPSSSESSPSTSWSDFGRRLLGSETETGLLAGARFDRIPNEGKWIKASVASLQGYVKVAPVVHCAKQALESEFKAMRGPRVLILSTHGYFLNDQMFDKLPQTPEGRRAWAALNDARLVGRFRDQMPFVPEPLLRCGLALAGANRHSQFRGANDGILTGLEILGTDLRGTELVVLNACQTGVGAVRDGEGTAGLHQAFHLAGARVVVASLWSIPAMPSNQLLESFFKNLAGGQSTAVSLRKSQLSMIAELRKEFGTAHPFLWAAFTMTGDCR
jgi:tetratricopeptide (TPR) repeat protein/CHAT domain-containing protein